MGPESIPADEREKYNALADKLTELQSVENDGRGVTCVRAIAGSLKRGDLEGARAEAGTDGDKIKNYPPIVKVIREELFAGVELPPHYWTDEEFKGRILKQQT